MSLFQCFIISLIAVASQLDSRILGRTNLERPLITCTLVGLFLGDLSTGLLVGAQMEMITLGMIAVGAVSGANMNLGAIIGCALVIQTGATVETALTIAVPVTIIRNLLWNFGHIIRVQLAHMCDKDVDEGKFEAAKRVNYLWGPLQYALLPAFIPCFIALYYGESFVNMVVTYIPDWINTGITLGANLISFYGFALLLTTMINKKNAIFFFIGFAIAAYSGLDLTAMAMISILTAVLLYMLRYQDKKQTSTVSAVDALEDLDN